jgi:hypothetical protein
MKTRAINLPTAETAMTKDEAWNLANDWVAAATAPNCEFTSSHGELDLHPPNGSFCRESLPYPRSLEPAAFSSENFSARCRGYWAEKREP